jgi:hypothetical protein
MQLKVIYNRREPVLILCVIIGVEVTDDRSVGRRFQVRKMSMKRSRGVVLVLFVLMYVHEWRLQEGKRKHQARENCDPSTHTTIVHRTPHSLRHCEADENAALPNLRWPGSKA